jgi:hypothetical protein
MNTKYLLIALISISSLTIVYGQEVSLQGRVIDSSGSALIFANTIAIPQTNGKNIIYSITDDQGRYKLLLQKNINYNIEVSYVGYQKIIDSIILSESTNKDFILTLKNQALNEVIIIEHSMPVLVKGDTITYRTGAFTNGEERKLGELLKKLPGVEVDRDGNVTVNGKAVDKLLVEGKPFFTGGTKLGVNNIPANVVFEVEVLNNYSEIPFLKGLGNDDRTAINIKLKEDKKKFIFGDLEAGVGIKDRYILHPTLFYYSPKLSTNFIGDLNNTGKKSFTFQDYINFEGGLSKLFDNPAAFFNLANSEFAMSLINRDFTYSKDIFGAFSLAKQLSPKVRLNAYSIVNNNSKINQIETIKTYLIDNKIFSFENRTTNSNTNNLYSLNKIELAYIPNSKENLSFETVFKTSNSNSNEQIKSFSPTKTNSINTQLEPYSLDILQNLGYSKLFSDKHTMTLSADFRFSNSVSNSLWLFTEPIFPNIIPIKGDSLFNINQNVEIKTNNLSLGIKHFWKLNNFNHIYPILGYNFSNQEYNTTNTQLFNGQFLSFNNAGFNNSVFFKLNDPFLGLQYRIKIKKIIIKSALIYHNYSWVTKQLDISKNNSAKSQFLPEFSLNWDLKNSEKFNIKYNLTSRFSDASFWANRLRLEGFNNIYRGSEFLGNTLAHQFSLNYHKFNLFKGLFYNIGLNYDKNIISVRNSALVEGINQINTPIYTDLPENTLGVIASLSKNLKTIKFTIKGNTSFSDYYRSINNQFFNYKSKNYNYTFKAETTFKKLPNIEIGINQYFNEFSSDYFQSKFLKTNPFILMQYNFLKSFNLKFDYNYISYLNKLANTENTFQLGNFSLFYIKNNNPWGFELEIGNIFDVKFKNENSYNQFIVSDTKTFIQPRTFLFKLLYKI